MQLNKGAPSRLAKEALALQLTIVMKLVNPSPSLPVSYEEEKNNRRDRWFIRGQGVEGRAVGGMGLR